MCPCFNKSALNWTFVSRYSVGRKTQLHKTINIKIQKLLMVIIIARGPYSMRDLNVLENLLAAEATPILIFI